MKTAEDKVEVDVPGGKMGNYTAVRYSRCSRRGVNGLLYGSLRDMDED